MPRWPTVRRAQRRPAADSDGDGVPDPYEMTMGTNPALADSDTDGLTDGLELAHGLDAHVIDTDTDGLSDAYELQAGGDATHADSDGDGFTDAYELATLGDPTFDTTGGAADHAGAGGGGHDRLGRRRAVRPAESTLGTNPLHEDSDDGLGDALEVARGTDPLVPATTTRTAPTHPSPRTGAAGASGG